VILTGEGNALSSKEACSANNETTFFITWPSADV